MGAAPEKLRDSARKVCAQLCFFTLKQTEDGDESQQNKADGGTQRGNPCRSAAGGSCLAHHAQRVSSSGNG